MANARRISDYHRVLVVEGYSDQIFYAEALERIDLADEIFIQQCNGRSSLDLKLQGLINPGFLSEKTHIGVIVDADQDARGAEQRFFCSGRSRGKTSQVVVGRKVLRVLGCGSRPEAERRGKSKAWFGRLGRQIRETRDREPASSRSSRA